MESCSWWILAICWNLGWRLGVNFLRVLKDDRGSLWASLLQVKAILVLWGLLQVSMNMNLSISEPDFVPLHFKCPEIAKNLHMNLSPEDKIVVFVILQRVLFLDAMYEIIKIWCYMYDHIFRPTKMFSHMKFYNSYHCSTLEFESNQNNTNYFNRISFHI